MGQVRRHEWGWVCCFSLVVVVIATLPYLVAWWLTPPGKFYTGTLLNPQDGQSYLAKMEQGAAGEWSFTLPYTTEAQQGAPVAYLYYLLLGHISGFLSFPINGVGHAARLLAGWALLLVAYRFIAEFISGVSARRMALAVLAFSSGLGWLLAVLWGLTAPDLWVAESNTFLSILVNPHFPLAETLMLLIFLLVAAPLERDAPQAEAPAETGPTPAGARGYLAGNGAHRYVLASPEGVAVNLPHARPKVRFGDYRVQRGGFKTIWVRRRPQGGLHLRVLHEPGSVAEVKLTPSAVQVTLKRSSQPER